MDRIVIEGRKLINGVERTSYASPKSKEFLDKPISGIRLFMAGGRIDFASTNGHRLAIYSTKLVKDGVYKRRAYTVPVKEMKELIQNVQKDENVKITVEEDKMTFNGQNFSKTINIIQGRYPPYYKVIPKEYNIKIKVSKDRLLNAINSVIKEKTHRADEIGPYERVVLRLQGKRLVVSTVSPKGSLPEDYKSRICDIPVELIHNYLNSEDEEYSVSPYVCLNEIYLKHAMKPISGAKVIIGFVNEYSPVAFISPDPAYGYLGLVMPMDPNGTYNQLSLVRV